ncbi:PH domain-containing protein [Modestobacter sp. URMC 112]
MAVARFRMSRTALLPVGLLLLCVLPVAAAAPAAAALLLVPVLAAAWVLWMGVDVDGDGEAAGVTVRSLLGRRRVPWSEVSGLRVGGRGELWLVTTGGREVRLPVLRLRDLPQLSAASGGRIPAPDTAAS